MIRRASRKIRRSLNAYVLAILALAAFDGVCSAAASQVQNQPLQTQATPLNVDEPSEYLEDIYRSFYEGYRLGISDEIAVRVLGEPDYSLEKTTVSPFGQIYHPLIGDVDAAGLTISGLTDKLTTALKEYLVNPRVSVALLEAKSAKIGVLGEVVRPGIIVMSEPMTVLSAIVAAGGVTDVGSKSELTLLRQNNDGRLRVVPVNLKRVLEGKANADENLTLRAGDTLIVQANLRKKLSDIVSLGGNFAYFLGFLSVLGR